MTHNQGFSGPTIEVLEDPRWDLREFNTLRALSVYPAFDDPQSGFLRTHNRNFRTISNTERHKINQLLVEEN